MERLGILVFYDKNGIFSEYIEYLLIALKEVVTYQIVIVNGFIQLESEKKLSRISDEVLIRENKGFDAGAYKDIFQNYLTIDKLKKYNEIIMCNDSFYGPFFPFSELWKRMKEYRVDFWGFTRHPEGIFGDGTFISSHIQSYFLIIKKSLFLSRKFQAFWNEEVNYETELIDVIKKFEIRFTTYFEEKGFVGMALTDLPEYAYINIQYNENPYLSGCYELITQGICPVLKRKSLLLFNKDFEKAFQTYKYICENTNYPEYLIKDHIWRLNREGNWCNGWNIEKLEKFYVQHRKVYIYGAGQWGRIIQNYFQAHRWNIAGVFVSAGENIVGSEQVFRTGILKEMDGIVIALGKNNLQLVIEKLEKSLSKQQMFIPDYK